MSGPRISLGLLLHSHQPVGNYDWVFEQNWQQSYRPMLEALHRHPGVQATAERLDHPHQIQPPGNDADGV